MGCTLINPALQLNVGVDPVWSILQTFGAGLRIADSGADHYVTLDVTVDQAADRALGIPLMAGAADIVVTNPTNDQTIGGNVIISGNLTVNGTSTTLNITTLEVDDNIFLLNADEIGTPSENIGMEGERGTSTNVQLIWNETTDTWQAGVVGSLEDVRLGTVGPTVGGTGLTSFSSGDVLYASGANTWAAAAAGATSGVQAYDAVLDDLAGLAVVAADQMIYGSGAGTYAYTALTLQGRQLLDDTSFAAMLTTLGAQAQGAVLDDLNTLGAPTADGEFIVGTGAGAFAYETGKTARTSMGSALNSITTVSSSPFTITASHQGHLVECVSGAVTINLTAVATLGDGFFCTVKRNGSAGTITIDGATTETIDGSLTYTLDTDHDTVTLYCDGTEVHVIAEQLNGTVVSNLGDLGDVTLTTPGTGSFLRKSAGDWVDSTLILPDALTQYGLLYGSATNTVGEITPGANAVLVTDGSNIPSLGTDIPTAVTIGSAYIYRAGGTDVAAADGGTGISSAGLTGIPQVTAGVWSIDANQDDLGDGATYKQYNPASVAITGGTVAGVDADLNDLLLQDAAEDTIDTAGDLNVTTAYANVGAFGVGAPDTLDAMSYAGGAPEVGRVVILTAHQSGEDITISHMGGANVNYKQFYIEGTAQPMVLTAAANDHAICVFANDDTWHVVNAKGAQMTLWEETFVGASQANDTLAQTPINQAHLEVYYNGVRKLGGGGNCWTVSGTTLTYIQAPAPGIDVYVRGWYWAT